MKQPRCRGAGVQVASRKTGGGASWNRKWVCDVCGRKVLLTNSGRIRYHHPRKQKVESAQ